MFGPITLFVMLGLALLGAAVALTFFDVTLRRSRGDATDREEEAYGWRPPYVRGRDLARWARRRAWRIVRERLATGRGPGAPAKLVEEIHKGAAAAMLPGAVEREVERRLPCPPGGQGRIEITPLEAIAIAEAVRRVLPVGVRDRIVHLSLERAEWVEADDAPCGPSCALQGADGACLAWPCRPLACRPVHAELAAARLDPDAGAGDPERPSPAAHARAVERGMNEGMAAALKEAGLDGDLYELHHALAVVLGTPDAAERWMVGEDVFAFGGAARA